MLEPYICYPTRVKKTVNTPSFSPQGIFTFGSTFIHRPKKVKEILPDFEKLELDNFDKFKEFVETYGISCFLTKDDWRADIIKAGSKDPIRKLSEISGYLKKVSEDWLMTFWKNNFPRLKTEQKALRELIRKYQQYRFEVKEHFDDPYRWSAEPDFLKTVFGKHFTSQDLMLINSKLSKYHPCVIKITRVDKKKFKKEYPSRSFRHIKDKDDWDKFQAVIQEISPVLAISSTDIDIVTRCYAEFCEWVSSYRSPRRCRNEKCQKYFIGRKNKIHCSDKCQKADEDKRRNLKKKTKIDPNQLV